MAAHSLTTVHLTQSLHGTCRRTIAIIEDGYSLRLVANRGHKLFTDKRGNLCTSKFHGAVASRKLYLQIQHTGEFLFRRDIEDATLFSDASRVLQRVIDMAQINCEHWAAIEIGNERLAAKVNAPKRTPFQLASLKAKAKADRTGKMVAIIVPKASANRRATS
jgi:hypothetical protein